MRALVLGDIGSNIASLSTLPPRFPPLPPLPVGLPVSPLPALPLPPPSPLPPLRPIAAAFPTTLRSGAALRPDRLAAAFPTRASLPFIGAALPPTGAALRLPDRVADALAAPAVLSIMVRRRMCNAMSFTIVGNFGWFAPCLVKVFGGKVRNSRKLTPHFMGYFAIRMMYLFLYKDI